MVYILILKQHVQYIRVMVVHENVYPPICTDIQTIGLPKIMDRNKIIDALVFLLHKIIITNPVAHYGCILCDYPQYNTAYTCAIRNGHLPIHNS